MLHVFTYLPLQYDLHASCHVCCLSLQDTFITYMTSHFQVEVVMHCFPYSFYKVNSAAYLSTKNICLRLH